jgi:hypothetical protein
MHFAKKLALLLICATSLSHAGALAGYQASGNTAHLTWTASTSTGGTVNVYRANGACTGTSAFAKIASSVAAGGPYDDTTVTVGTAVGSNTATYCYYVTAFVNGAESLPSNSIALTFTNTVRPSPPQGLAGEDR